MSNSDSDAGLKAPAELLKAQSMANTLDTAVRLPIIGIKVGLDFLVGLIPVVGDAIMLLASLRIVHLGHKMGVPKALKTKMLRNCLLDFLLGFVPFLGDIVDIWFKANQRNVRIMEKWWVSENKQSIDAMRAKMLKEWKDGQQ
ncbi:DUF4112 domain-containing protein [Glaciecola siphonariae]|uniref:DUF4112 domain-containing protein n=1 Tax=Glaciecola siphonariae TaxID=521012 RepID=A0ABV9LZT4_9ALTE